MTPEQFCYWLQGYLEITDVLETRPAGLTEKQRQVVCDHLNLVFTKVTPNRKEPVVLSETTEGKPLKKKKTSMEEVIDELQKTRPGVTCDPFSMPGRIC